MSAELRVWGLPPQDGSHELGKIHSIPVSEKLRKSVPLALCVHMFIALATPLPVGEIGLTSDL